MPKKAGKGKVKVGIREAGPVHIKNKKPTGKPPGRIRMLMMLANQEHVYLMGHSYKVPQEVSVDTARRWLRSGAAEEDKSLAGVPEETR